MTQDSSKSDPLRAGAYKPVNRQSIDTTTNYRLTMHPPTWRPPTDVYENEDLIVVRVEIAGMQDDDFSIKLDGRIITIRGLRQDFSERSAYHQMEIHFGEFFIELLLPASIEPNQVEAVYNNGFLSVFLPKARPRRIQIAE